MCQSAERYHGPDPYLVLISMQCDNPTAEAAASEKVIKPHPLGTFAIFAAIFLITFLPSYLARFGLLDDYYILDLTLTKGAFCPEIIGNMMAQGRPLNLPFIAAAFSPLHGIGDIVYLRVIATLGIALLATLFFRHSMHVGWNRAQSLALSLLVFSQLPFQVLAGWGLVGFLGAFRIPLAYVSYFLAKYTAEKPVKSLGFAGMYLATLLCLTAAMAMHQTAAMFFWIAMAQDALSPKRWEMSGKLLNVIFTTFGSACCIELLISLFGKKNYAEYLIQDRKDLTLDPLQKLVWFFAEPLNSCLNFNNLNASFLVAIGFAALIIAGLTLFVRKLEPKNLLKQRVLLLLALPFLCYTPNLIVAESWASYRTLYALSTLMVIYLFCAIQGIGAKLSLSSRAITLTLFLAALLNLFCANRSIATYIAEPQAKELELVRYRLQNENSSEALKHLEEQMQPPKGKGPFDMWNYDKETMLPSWDDVIAPAAFYDEFGRTSSSRPFVGKAMVHLLLRENAGK